MKKILIIIPLLFLINIFLINATTYYLSPTGSDTIGDGSYNNPWFSPAKARKSQSSVQPGDTIVFKNGRYNYTSNDDCRLGYSNNDSGTKENRILYTVESKGGVILDFNTYTGWDLAEGADYITLDGFIVVDIGNYGYRLGGLNQTIVNCNATATNTWPPSGSTNIKAQAGGCFSTVESANNFLFDNILADDCANDTASHGIYVAGGSGVISNSIFRNNLANGIQIQAGTADHDIGIVKVYNNKVYNNGGRVYVSAYGGGTIDEVWIYNNLIYNNGFIGVTHYSLTVGGASTGALKKAYIYHNTIANGIDGYQGYGPNITFANNIISNMSNSYVGWNTLVDTGLNATNNCIEGDIVNPSYNFYGQDECYVNFVSEDPFAENFLKLESGSPAIDTGVNVGITTDFKGTSRPQESGYDIGAYEYIPSEYNTYYVSNAPCSNSWNGDESHPVCDITTGVSLMSPGDTLILKDGTYSGTANLLKPPSGTNERYTIIKAEHDGKAIIDGSNITGEYDYPVLISNKEYIQVEGLSIRNKSNSEMFVIYDSKYIKVLRTSIINKQNYAGSILRITSNSSYVLLEDVWLTGAGRYQVIIFKPTEEPNKAPHNIILRRVVVRHDYRRRDEYVNNTMDPSQYAQAYPVAGIQIYGAQAGDDSELVTRDIVLQNCIAIDFNYGEEYYQMIGGLSVTARVNNVTMDSNIILNINGKGICLPNPFGCSYGSAFSGYSIGDNRLGNGGNFKHINNVVFNTSGNGFWVQSGSKWANKTSIIKGNTVGLINGTGASGPRAIIDVYSTLKVNVTNNLFFETGLTAPRYGPGTNGTYTEDYNWYYPNSIIPKAATNVKNTIPLIQYVVVSPDDNSGLNGEKRGATILNQTGISGTLWDEPGWNVTTNIPLWPYPYEDQIKSAFSEKNDPFTNSYPKTNDVNRGFCKNGTGLYGGPITLTSYIWEYLGNPCPENICNYTYYHKADLDHSGKIETNELKSFLQRWKQHLESFTDMFDVVSMWKSG